MDSSKFSKIKLCGSVPKYVILKKDIKTGNACCPIIPEGTFSMVTGISPDLISIMNKYGIGGYNYEEFYNYFRLATPEEINEEFVETSPMAITESISLDYDVEFGYDDICTKEELLERREETLEEEIKRLEKENKELKIENENLMVKLNKSNDRILELKNIYSHSLDVIEEFYTLCNETIDDIDNFYKESFIDE